MRDTVKTEEYFRERYNKDTAILDERISKYKEVISHPEKYNVWSYKYDVYIEINKILIYNNEDGFWYVTTK